MRTSLLCCLLPLLLCAGLGLAAAPQSDPLPPATAPLQVPDTLAQRALACTGCHGPQGRASPLGYVPRIAGKPAQYLQQQLMAFRDGRRAHDGMARLLQHLDDDFLAALAGHFAAQRVLADTVPTAAAEPASLALGQRLAQQGDASRQLPACVRCHGAALTGAMPALPGLLGLPRGYLVAQLGAWRTGVRRAAEPDCMASLVKRLTPQDIAGLADWLASQPLPAQSLPAASLPEPLPLDCGTLSR